jgi:HAD superfamily hydrolase (TIGR01509 family)
VTPIDVAILDVDGTVATCPYDFDAMRAEVATVATRHGVEVSTLTSHGILERIDEVACLLGDRGLGFRREAEAAVAGIEVDAARGSTLLPGAVEALARLRSGGVAIALITRNCRAAAALVLQGLRDYDVLLTRDDVPHAKPDPDHVLRSLHAVDRRPENAVLVGDHFFDIQAGRAAGVRFCVGVRTGNSPEESLREAGAHGVLDSIADLPDWLSRAVEVNGR